jgi:hypothetical protein
MSEKNTKPTTMTTNSNVVYRVGDVVRVTSHPLDELNGSVGVVTNPVMAWAVIRLFNGDVVAMPNSCITLVKKDGI